MWILGHRDIFGNCPTLALRYKYKKDIKFLECSDTKTWFKTKWLINLLGRSWWIWNLSQHMRTCAVLQRLPRRKTCKFSIWEHRTEFIISCAGLNSSSENLKKIFSWEFTKRTEIIRTCAIRRVLLEILASEDILVFLYFQIQSGKHN